MCGIVGIFDLSERSPIDRAVLEKMNETQHHRGPDGGGLFTDPGVGLGHRRLSIIDLATGDQPLFNDDQSVVVVFNGEIYNFQALAAELQAKGYKFKTRSDTEVIVHAWREWGEDCVSRFRGMFAFAIYDRRDDLLFLARDRLGIKPLYYAEAGSTLLFGSELKAVMAYPGVSRAIDPFAVDDYFALGYVPEPRSIYASVRKLSPGYTLTVRRGGVLRPHQYWDLSFRTHHKASPTDLCDELIERLTEAVKLRMISDVPLGAFLSGGVDSSAVVAMMARVSDLPVNTCSIGFDEGSYDETEFAQMVAERCRTAHAVETVATNDFELVSRLGAMFDEPFADSSAIPTYRVCALARRKVTVALSGDGGDELFAGYSRYRWQMSEERLRGRIGRRGAAAMGALLSGLGGMLHGSRLAAAAETLQGAGMDPMDSYLGNIGVFTRGARRRLYTQDMRSDLQGYDAGDTLKSLFREAPADDFLSALQYVDYKTYLPGDILTKVDRTSMAVALEARVPIIDHEFVEWAVGIEPGLRLKGRNGKYIFKKALEPYLPHDILYRNKKGFAVPLAAWFRGPLRDRLDNQLVGGVLADSGIFDMTEIRRLVDQHERGRADNSGAIWSLLMFDAFLRQQESNGEGRRKVA